MKLIMNPALLMGLLVAFLLPTDIAAKKTIFTYNNPDLLAICGENPTGHFGFFIATGDINGDGIEDVVTSVPYYHSVDPNIKYQGEVHLFYGGMVRDWPIDLNQHPGDFVVIGAEGDDRLGRNLACGDINGDDLDDVFMGAPGADGAGNSRDECGEIYVFFGHPNLSGTIDLEQQSPDIRIIGKDDEDHIGTTPDSQRDRTILIKDINHDGKNDIIISALGGDGPANQNSYAGEVYVIFGRDSYPALIDLAVDTPDVTIYGPQQDSTFGTGLAVGDLNNDLKTDLIISSVRWDGPSNDRTDAGRVDIFYGRQNWDAVIDLSVTSSDVMIWGIERYHLGCQVECGDINADGLDDLLVTADKAPGRSDPRLEWGRGYVFFGSSLPSLIDLTVDQPDITIYGRDYEDKLGSSLAVGDVNGDQIDDILIGTDESYGPQNDLFKWTGELYVIHGGQDPQNEYDMVTFIPDVTIYGPEDSSMFSTSLELGDFTGDGLDDIIVSADEAGRISIDIHTEGVVFIIGSTPDPGPFDLYRSIADPANIPIYAQEVDSFYDDMPNLLTDGQLYFYNIESRDSRDVTIGLWKEPHTNSMRIVWDDGGIGQYVAPDIDKTEVGALPTCLSADGLTEAHIVVVPMDEHGVKMGPGYDVAIDTTSLMPGIPSGSITVNLNGTYTLPVIATQTGSATVSAHIEGVPIPKNPVINYVDTVPTADFEWSTPAAVGEPIDFTNLTTAGTPPYTFFWFFNDRELSESADEHPVFIYDTPGAYEVFLQVTDSNSCVDAVFHEVTVGP
ncbi:PKD domain-containing protein [Acidobacteriota bacterium]